VNPRQLHEPGLAMKVFWLLVHQEEDVRIALKKVRFTAVWSVTRANLPQATPGAPQKVNCPAWALSF
jgi:hypothetical protein